MLRAPARAGPAEPKVGLRTSEGRETLFLDVLRKDCLECPGPNPDPREDLESRSPNLGPYTTKLLRVLCTPIKGSTFWILPGVWEVNFFFMAFGGKRWVDSSSETVITVNHPGALQIKKPFSS